MKIVSLEKFSVRRKNILCDLSEYYCDPEEWKEASSDLVRYSVFYHNVFENWIEAALLYNYDFEDFGQSYLSTKSQLRIDESKLQPHHYGLVRDYLVDKSLIDLILTGDIDKNTLLEASEFHSASLLQNGFANEVEAVAKLDTESMLSDFVPQIIVKILLGHDYTSVLSKISPNIKSKEKIWKCAWRFLYYFSSEEPQLEKSWNELLNEWINCYEKSDYHSFSKSCFVWIFYLYCKSSKQDFSLKKLSNYILTNE